METGSSRIAAPAALLAAAMLLLSLTGFGLAFDGYSQARHPPALLGARGIDHAVAFNLLGFVLPGLLAAVVAGALRRRLDGASAIARVGSWLWLLSALAFAAQGVFVLDPNDLDAPTSQRHATAWSLWWIAFVPGACLLALGLGGESRWRALRLVAAVAAVLVPVFVLFPPMGLPVGAWQRTALMLWLSCVVVAGFAARCRPQP